MDRRIDRNISDFLPNRINPILGQQRPRDPGKKYKTLAEMLFWSLKVSVALMIIAILAYVFYMVRGTLLHSPQFQIAVKEAQGLRHISENQVLMKVKAFEGQEKNIFALNLDQLRQSIEQLPWVQEAVVRRTPPDKLLIEIKERVPVAFVRFDNATQLVDEEGIFLETSSEEAAHLDFPVIQGFESGLETESLARNKKRLSAFRDLVRILDENGAGLSKDISEVFLADPEDIAIILNGETVLVRLGNSGFQDKFRRYLALGRELRQKYPQLDTVDLRYQNQIVVSMAGDKQVVTP
jgi:cell division protein FtsQ